jgi:Flp pilus assembly protein TadD
VPQRYAQWKSQAANRYADPSPELQRGAAALLAQKRHAEAIEVCGLWSALAPDDAIALDALATAYKSAGDMARARTAWERAAKADPKLASSMDVPRKLRELP